MHVIWVWPMSHFVTFYVKVNFCTNIHHNLNCCFPFVVVELYKLKERFCELIISIWSLILRFEKGVGWRGCGNKDSHANSPAKFKLMLIFKRKIIHGISLKVRLFYHISRESIFSKYTRVAMSDSSRIFLFHSSTLSEGTGTNHSHHHYVANCCQDSNPQPNGVTGHFAVILGFRGPRIAGVEVGRRRLQGRVAVVRRIHEGPAHSRELLPGK